MTTRGTAPVDECRYEGVGRAGVAAPAVPTTSAEAAGGVMVTFAGGPRFPYALHRSVNVLNWTLQWPGRSMPTWGDLAVSQPEQVTALRLLLHRVQAEMTVAGLWPNHPDEVDMTMRVRGSLMDHGNPLDEVDAGRTVPSGDAETPLRANGAHISVPCAGLDEGLWE